MVIMWMVLLTDRSLTKNIASGVTAEKISPDNDITQPNLCKYHPIPNNPIPVSFEP